MSTQPICQTPLNRSTTMISPVLHLTLVLPAVRAFLLQPRPLPVPFSNSKQKTPLQTLAQPKSLSWMALLLSTKGKQCAPWGWLLLMDAWSRPRTCVTCTLRVSRNSNRTYHPRVIGCFPVWHLCLDCSRVQSLI
jgi:hypothetical protein